MTAHLFSAFIISTIQEGTFSPAAKQEHGQWKLSGSTQRGPDRSSAPRTPAWDVQLPREFWNREDKVQLWAAASASRGLVPEASRHAQGAGPGHHCGRTEGPLGHHSYHACPHTLTSVGVILFLQGMKENTRGHFPLFFLLLSKAEEDQLNTGHGQRVESRPGSCRGGGQLCCDCTVGHEAVTLPAWPTPCSPHVSRKYCVHQPGQG